MSEKEGKEEKTPFLKSNLGKGMRDVAVVTVAVPLGAALYEGGKALLTSGGDVVEAALAGSSDNTLEAALSSAIDPLL